MQAVFFNRAGQPSPAQATVPRAEQLDEIMLRGVVTAPDGSQVIRLAASGSDPVLLGKELARQALDRGARVHISQNSAEEMN